MIKGGDAMLQPVEIKKIPLFEKMSDDVLKELFDRMVSKTFKKGEYIFYKGDEGDSLYIIRSGKIKISIPTEEGEELIISIFSDGDFFGELSLLDGSCRSADAVALEDTKVFILHRDTFYSYIQNKKEVLETIISTLCGRLRKTDDLLTDMCYSNITKRLIKLLIELAGKFGRKKGEDIVIDVEITQSDLGAMLGVTRETVNRELMKLKAENIIGKDKKRIVIYDISRLLDLI